MKTKKITDLMELLRLLEGTNPPPYAIDIVEVLTEAQSRPEEVFAVILGNNDIAIIRKNSLPEPIQFVDIKRSLSVSVIPFDHLPRVVPLKYDSILFCYE